MSVALDAEPDAVVAALHRLRPWVESVSSVQRLSGGMSREIWAADVSGGSRRQRVVVRRDPPGIDQGPAWASLQASKAVELAAMSAARTAGVPVPEPWGLLRADDGLGEGIVMERVCGATVAARILREPELAGARAGLARECGRVLGRLHGVRTDPVAGVAVDPVAQWRGLLDRTALCSPVLEYALRYLVERAPPARRPVLVHGDFRLGNLVVDAGGLVAVLDWEAVHVGAAGEDLGWLCVSAFRSGRPLAVGGFGTVADLLDGYAETSGDRVDPAELRYWQIFSTLRWAVMTQMLAELHLSGTRPSLELALTGRERAAAEDDLVRLVRDALRRTSS